MLRNLAPIARVLYRQSHALIPKHVTAVITGSYVRNRLFNSKKNAPLARDLSQSCFPSAPYSTRAAPTRNPNLQLADTEVRLLVGNDYDPNDELVGPRPDWWWTGAKPPADGSPVASLPPLDLVNYTREQVLAKFENQWLLTEVLFESLQGERAFTVPQYHGLRHPLIFYLNHVAVIFMMKLRVAGLLPLLEDAETVRFEQIFETGVDEMSWDDMSKNEMEWPSVRSVVEYRRKCFQEIKNLILTSEYLDGRPITMDSPAWAIPMGLAHEAIHLETSSVLMRETPLKYLQTPTNWAPLHPSVNGPSAHPPLAGRDYPQNPTIEVNTTDVILGKPKDLPSFGWDNEYGARQSTVEAFRGKAMLVSNGDFHEFVCSGGYREKKYWSNAGWEWRCFRNAKWPTFWVAFGPAGSMRFKLRTVFEVVDMPWSWPAEVNMHEAEAFCSWRSERDGVTYVLPSEEQHNAMRGSTTPQKRAELDLQLDSIGMQKVRNTNLAFGSASPVNAFSPNDVGVYDALGNVYQYAADDLRGLDGFAVHSLYEDFSLPCIDGKHFIILGGSFMSTDNLTSPFARYHFRKHFFQHCGFRMVETNEKKLAEGHHKYESNVQLQEYFALHFGSPSVQLPINVLSQSQTEELQAFPQRCADKLANVAKHNKLSLERALDVGCAVGGSSFELTRHFDQVVGIDFSEMFITAANVLRDNGSYTYRIKESGERMTAELVAKVDADIDVSRVSFEVGDACNLREDLGQFDAILAANLLCRLPNPRAFLDRLNTLLAPNGIVMFTSPFSWFPEYTPVDEWIGGTNDIASETALAEEMQSRGFELLEEADIPLMMREHKRKFQFIVPHMTIWQKK